MKVAWFGVELEQYFEPQGFVSVNGDKIIDEWETNRYQPSNEAAIGEALTDPKVQRLVSLFHRTKLPNRKDEIGTMLVRYLLDRGYFRDEWGEVKGVSDEEIEEKVGMTIEEIEKVRNEIFRRRAKRRGEDRNWN